MPVAPAPVDVSFCMSLLLGMKKGCAWKRVLTLFNKHLMLLTEGKRSDSVCEDDLYIEIIRLISLTFIGIC